MDGIGVWMRTDVNRRQRMYVNFGCMCVCGRDGCGIVWMDVDGCGWMCMDMNSRIELI
jgi:hypothetical protein